MKFLRLALLILCSAYAFLSPLAQTDPSRAQQPTTQSTDLAESEKLSIEVIKLYEAGKFAEALPLAKRALKIREKSLGPNHKLVAVAEINLAGVYLGNKNLEDAESMYRKALAIYEMNPDEHDPHVGQLLDRLARLSLLKRDFEKAEDLYTRAVAAKEKSFGPDHAETIESVNNLATFYSARHEYEKAEPLLRRILSIREKSLDPTAPALAHSLERLACVMYREKKDSEAQKLEERANDILYKDAAGKPEPIPLPLDVFTCKMINNPHPVFPEAAKGGRFTGATTLKVAVVVDETGKVISAHMVEGNPLFKESSEKAALSALFRPTVVDGHPVKVSGEIIHQLMTKTSLMMVGPVPLRP